MKRNVFRIMLELTSKQPWLHDKSQALEELLFEECQDDETRELLIDLINRFEFLDNNRYQFLMRKIALDIVTEPQLHEQSTLISAMSIGSGVDSGQAIIYSLKLFLQELNWTNHKLINDAMQAYKAFKNNAPLKDIILVDEFVGSGKTVIDRVDTIKRQFSIARNDDFTIKVKVLAATEKGISNVLAEGIDITSEIKIKKGISDYYTGEEAKEMRGLMLAMENILSKEYKGRNMPTMGYGEAEALYYRKDINLPNSVFPIFWWAEYLNKSARKTLLFRAMGDA
ncbi:hypothetical protein [Serratia fonticola]|uniref:phosphoribosyltransferase-like protein n=1 Tax=Serratia fonticola TaxID=47917 RepID=UPI00192BEC84|nr:hypothetical protein [Serratia fonticola]MBL5904618.1 hypothetical protein [Serratia fonticola]